MNTSEFNEKYKDFLVPSESGLEIAYPCIIEYLDQIFTEWKTVPGFNYSKITTKFGLARIYCNLQELWPLSGNELVYQVEERINLLLRIEREIDIRKQKGLL